MIDDSVLDDPVGQSLSGPHAHLARRLGGAATYCADVATFSAAPVQPGARDWAGLAALLGPGAFADMFSCSAGPPPGWEPVFSLAGRQLLWSGGPLPDRRGAEPDSDMVVLGKDEVPEMLDLVARTEPGPFRSPHPRLGTYLGVRDDGALVARAGERLRSKHWWVRLGTSDTDTALTVAANLAMAVDSLGDDVDHASTGTRATPPTRTRATSSSGSPR